MCRRECEWTQPDLFPETLDTSGQAEIYISLIKSLQKHREQLLRNLYPTGTTLDD
jgi:hypothetical protein